MTDTPKPIVPEIPAISDELQQKLADAVGKADVFVCLKVATVASEIHEAAYLAGHAAGRSSV